MNLQNVKLNKKYSYKELCNILGEEPKRGKAQQLHLKKIQENLVLSATGKGKGKKYIVTEVLFTKNSEKAPYYTYNNIYYSAISDKKVNKTSEDEELLKLPTTNDSNNYILRQLLKVGLDKFVGLHYDNWKNFCIDINLDYKKDHENEMKVLEQIYKLDKKGNGFDFMEKYNLPIPKEDCRTDKLTSWAMGDILIEQLYTWHKEGQWDTFFSWGKLYEYCGLHNEEYLDYKYNHKQLASEMDMKLNVVNDFYNVCNATFKNNIKKGLKNLDNRCLAFYYDSFAICEIRYNKDGLPYEYHRTATTREINIILEHERKAMRSMGCSSKKDIWKKNRWKEFLYLACQGIKAEMHIYKDYEDVNLSHIKYYYKCIKVIYNYKDVEEAYFDEVLVDRLARANEQSCKKVEQTFDTKAKHIKECEQYKEDTDKLIDKLLK